jgi:CheY-like chemotaxis protein
MGGQIGAESTVGVGSVFWIDLTSAGRLEVVSGSPESRPIARSQVLTGERIRTLLCVEDNPANLMLVEGILERRPDIRLLTARDGGSGVEMARSCQPDVILMDINLPGISGIEALKILAANPLTAQIPVIALSANAMPRDIEKGLEAGFFRYLTKPIKVLQFMETLDIALKLSSANAALADQEKEPPMAAEPLLSAPGL